MKSIILCFDILVLFLSICVYCERPFSPYEYIDYNSQPNPYMRRADPINESKIVRQSDTDYSNENYVYSSTAAMTLDLTNESQMSGNYSTENDNNLSIESRLESNISNIVANDTKSAMISIFRHFINRYRVNDNRTNETNDSIKRSPEPDDSPKVDEYSTDFYASTPFYDFDPYQSSR